MSDNRGWYGGAARKAEVRVLRILLAAVGAEHSMGIDEFLLTYALGVAQNGYPESA
jgi:hypothetical protein